MIFLLQFCFIKPYNLNVSTDDINNFRQIITSDDYRLTDARKATIRLLVSSKPQAIAEILTKAKAANVDRVSVYRNIELFEKLGIVHRLYVGWKYKLEIIYEFIGSDASKVGFVPRRHIFEVDGYYKDCKYKKSAKTLQTI